jgi:hypothetical protein
LRAEEEIRAHEFSLESKAMADKELELTKILEKNIKVAEQKIALLEKELADAKKILTVSNQALFDLQEKSKQVNQTKDLTSNAPVVESKPELTSLINQGNEVDVNKNDSTSPADTSFKSSISDSPIEEKANAQLASDKEASSVSSSSGLFIFLGVLFAILVMLFVIKTKRQKEQKELIDSISTDKEKLYSEEHGVEASPAINGDTIKDINLSDTTGNLSDTDQKPTHSD